MDSCLLNTSAYQQVHRQYLYREYEYESGNWSQLYRVLSNEILQSQIPGCSEDQLPRAQASTAVAWEWLRAILRRCPDCRPEFSSTMAKISIPKVRARLHCQYYYAGSRIPDIDFNTLGYGGVESKTITVLIPLLADLGTFIPMDRTRQHF